MALSEYQKRMAEFKNNGRPLPEKKVYRIPKVSKKRAAKIAEQKTILAGDDTELQKFFKKAMKQMVGSCFKCGAKTETHLYQFAILSICHILPKRPSMCPSVALHPLNWIELCPDHHTEFDRVDWESRETWGCWPEIRDRLVMVYPDLAEKEKRHFPESVLKFMEKNNPFQNQK